MHIHITHIDETPIGPVVVFETQIGVGKGIWQGTLPQLDTVYDVEIEIRETLIWGDTIQRTHDQTPKMLFKDDRLLIIGHLEQVETDAIVVVRVGTSLMMLETHGTPAALGDTIQINCYVPDLYDTKI